jgi:hypothetical protein
MTAGIKALLAAIADIGHRDIYTDAPEYASRTAAMHDLCDLAEQLSDSREPEADDFIKLRVNQIYEVIEESWDL